MYNRVGSIYLNGCFLMGLFIIVFLMPQRNAAQPTDKKVEEVSSSVLGYVGNSPKEIRQKEALEKSYLKTAKENIELYRKGDGTFIVTDRKGNPLKNIQITINQSSQDFLFGNIVFDIAGFAPDSPYKEDLYRERFKDLFNLAVTPFYWNGYERRAGNPSWNKNEAAIDWCLSNNIKVKGHPLAWTSPAGTPKWLLKQPDSIATTLLKARIYNNVIGYKDRIGIWDVVNEPINTVPWSVALKDTLNSNALRYNMDNITVEQIAPWVDKAYKWAKEANPNAEYVLNEFFTLAIPDVRDRFYKLLKLLKQKGTPIDAIGIQAHEPREMWFSPVEFYKTLDLYAEFDLPIQITEFIPLSSGKEITGWRTGIWTEETQSEYAVQFYTLAFGHPSVNMINWWGLTDRDIWLKGGGLLDENYNPKPVYKALHKLIKVDWMTKDLELKTNRRGEISFRGFYGDYEVQIKDAAGTIHKESIHLKKESENVYKIEL